MRAASVPLGDVVELRSGVGFPTHLQGRTSGDFPLAKVGDISSVARVGQRHLQSTPNWVDKSDLETLSTRPFPPGTVVFAKIGEAIRQNFRAIATVPILLDNNAMGAIPGNNVDATYLYHFLTSVDLYPFAQSTTVPSIRKTELARVPLPLPPIEEQRRIAAVLDAADALRDKRRQALAKLDTLTQSIFFDMFASRQSEWPRVAVDHIASDKKGSIRTGPFGSQLLHDEFVDAGVAVLGIDNVVRNHFIWAERRFITAGKYEQLRRYQVFPGDVLVTIMGTCGRVAIVPDDIPEAINTKHLCCITANRDLCLPQFLWACLRFDPQVLRQLGATHGAVMPGLNMGRIKAAEIPLPPLELQGEFVERRDAAERAASKAAASYDALDSLFASLQQRAFRGEL
jgi:type I restriction enzyme, S subunit